MPPVSRWSPEQDQLLRACFDEGMSAAQAAIEITNKFNMPTTRNAVIGRATRLGIKSKLTPADGPRMTAGARMASERVSPRKAKPKPPPQAFTTDWISGLRCVEIDPLNTALDDLQFGQCHWPYGDGPFTFCGHPAVFGSYCGPHYALSIGPGTSSEQHAHRVSRRVA